MSFLVVLSACGGDGSGGGGDRDVAADAVVGADAEQRPGEPPDDTPLDGTDVSGRVLDAVTGVAIPGVEVRLVRPATGGNDAVGPEAVVTTTLSDGRYAFDGLPVAGDYAATFDVDGYKNETYSNIALDGTAGSALEPVHLVSDDNAGTGQHAGLVSGAADGRSPANLTLDFREGINRRAGEVIATARTAADGRYRADGIGYGNVTAEIGGEGIRTRYATFQVLGNLLSTGRTVTVSAADADGVPAELGALRIVLTWDERPNDLDAHLTGPAPDGSAYFHVFSGDRDAETTRLVDDATTGAGPETVEIERRDAGVYRYSVFNFSGDADRPLTRSGARVEVFAGDASVAEFRVPAGVGDLWTVFDIDGERIVAVNAITRRRNVLDHFPPQGRRLAYETAIASGAMSPRAGGWR